MIVSISEIREYLSCRRKWHLGSTNRLRLSPIVTKPQLSLGKNIHAALAGWMADPSADVIALYMISTAKELYSVEKFYREQLHREPTEEDLGPILDNVRLGQAMLGNYRERWGKPLPDHLKIVSPEQEVVVDIPGTEHSLKCILDAIAVSMQTNKKYIIDHKTYSMKPRDETLRYDFQFKGYVWAGRRLGIDVEGVGYDGLWKRLEPPKGKSIEDLFHRLIIRPSVDEIAEFEGVLRIVANEMASNPIVYPNWKSDGSCVWGCSFKELCIAITRDEDADYVQQQKYYQRPEREAPEETYDAA